MNKQLKLHAKLTEEFPDLPAYFRPPSKLMLKYPCIVYTLSDVDTVHANGKPFNSSVKFSVSFLSKTPGTTDLQTVLDSIPYSSLKSVYQSKDIVHDVFNVYVN